MAKKHEKIYLGVILAFTYLPILSLMIFSFNKDQSLTKLSGFSLSWYAKLFDKQESELSIAIFNTVLIAVTATFFATVIGTLAALSLSKNRKLVRNIVFSANNIPILNPEIVTAVALVLVFVTFSVTMGLFTMLLAHIAFCTPYVLITVYPRLRSLDPNLGEAACDLGASPFQALRKVIFPEIKTSVIAGAIIAFTMSFDDFVISYFTGGSNENISIYLYNLIKKPTKMTPVINALSTIIIVAIFTIVLLNLLFKRKKQEEKE